MKAKGKNLEPYLLENVSDECEMDMVEEEPIHGSGHDKHRALTMYSALQKYSHPLAVFILLPCNLEF